MQRVVVSKPGQKQTMWTKIPLIALGFILATAAVTPATAHSLKRLEARLYDREKYFQPFDKQTPEFELQDADGRAVRLGDFRQKVVVLHFVYTNCPDVCPLHAEKLAEVQEMVNGTPMKELVRFVSITTDPGTIRPRSCGVTARHGV